MNLGVNQIHAWVRKHHQVSESALALTFAEAYGDRWRYNTDEGYWLQWVGTHWSKRQTPELLDAMRHFLTLFAKSFVRALIISNAEGNKLQTQRSISAIEKLCRALPSFLARSVLFDSDPFLLGTPGGTIDLKTGETKKSDPGDHITILAPVTPAKAKTKHPRWSKFMNDITGGDKDFQTTLQQWAGISATGTSRDQRILFLYGPGGNGKGVLLRTIAGLLGEHAVNAPRDMLMMEKYSRHNTHLVDVLKCRMALATEIDDDATWDVALVKDITGGDMMSVNRMRQDPFRLKPCCSITISGNKKPALKGIDDAVRRRFLVGTFPVKIDPDKVIPDLEHEFIREEGPAILRWIIDGAVARENSKTGLFVAKAITDDTEDYFAEENVLEDFISTYLTAMPATADPPHRVKTSVVYAAWKGFCDHSGRPAGARNSFTTAMQAAGVKYHRAMDGRYFLNVIMKSGMEM